MITFMMSSKKSNLIKKYSLSVFCCLITQLANTFGNNEGFSVNNG